MKFTLELPTSVIIDRIESARLIVETSDIYNNVSIITIIEYME